MIMSDFKWHIIRNITGVTGFVGPGSAPTPLSPEEVASLGLEATDEGTVQTKESTVTLAFGVGDSVRIKAGVFTGYIGKVDVISDDFKTVTVLVSMFGRETPTQLDAKDVEILEV